MEVTVQKRRKPGIFSNVNKPTNHLTLISNTFSSQLTQQRITEAGGREFRFRGDLYSQESTFPLVIIIFFQISVGVPDVGDIIIIIFKYALISETANIQERRRGTLHSQFSTLRPVSIKSVKCGLRK